jgi:hypothetical protein
LALTSVTFSNPSGSPVKVEWAQSRAAPGTSCSQASDIPSSLPFYPTMMIPPMSTLHLTFPTPMVYTPIDGSICFVVKPLPYVNTDPLHIMFNGYTY